MEGQDRSRQAEWQASHLRASWVVRIRNRLFRWVCFNSKCCTDLTQLLSVFRRANRNNPNISSLDQKSAVEAKHCFVGVAPPCKFLDPRFSSVRACLLPTTSFLESEAIYRACKRRLRLGFQISWLVGIEWKRTERDCVVTTTNRKIEALGHLLRPLDCPSLIRYGTRGVQFDFKPDYTI